GVSSSWTTRFAAPAEFTSTSSGPNSFSTRSTIAAAAVASVRSAAMAYTSPSVLFAEFRLSDEREVIATRAPSARKALAQARPMPLLPPVMRTFLCLRPRSINAPGVSNSGQGRIMTLLSRRYTRAMAQAQTIQVSQLLDEGGIRPFHIRLIVWSVLIAFIDGYDISAIALAAPELVRAWKLSPAALGPVLSASLIGILFGSMLFGWIGDRYGRKAALIGSLVTFGIFTWIAAHATNLEQMFWLRFLAGLGIGGVILNTTALTLESAPRPSLTT